MKKKININIEEYSPKNNAKDTGSVSSQIAILNARIKYLTDHVKRNRHDNVSILSLKKIVSKKKRLNKYVVRENLRIKNKSIEA